MLKWDFWPLETHFAEEQIKRILSANDVTFKELNKNDLTAITTTNHNVSLAKCDCPDFTVRQLPCKHIYKLAQETGRMKTNDTLSKDNPPIADFSDGFAKGWKFAVGKWFMKNLDLTYDQIYQNQEMILRPRQGYDFYFSPGSIFYDTQDTYKYVWSKAIQNLNICIQIHDSFKNKRSYFFEYDVRNVLKARMNIVYSATVFDIFTPDENCRKLEKRGRYSCMNDEFVRFLTTGVATLSNGEIITTDDF